MSWKTELDELQETNKVSRPKSRKDFELWWWLLIFAVIVTMLLSIPMMLVFLDNALRSIGG